MRAAIYARVSTDRQGRDQTIDSQLDALRRWATAHGHELKDDHVYHRRGLLRGAARPPGPRPPPRRRPRGRVRRRRRLQPRPAGPPLRLPGPPAGGVPQGRLRGRVRPAADLRRPARPAPAPDPGGHRRVRAGRARRAVPPRQAPEGPGRPVGRRPGPLRLPLRAQAGRRARAPGGRRGRGRGRPDALPLADRRADDRPPDPQAAGRRAVAAAERQAALVEQRRPSHPLRPALHRHGLRQPACVRRAPQAPDHAGRGPGTPTCRRPRPREEWIPIPVPAIIDESTSSRCERATGPQLGPVVPQQHPQRLPAPLPADLPDVRPGHVRHHHQRNQAGAPSTGTTSATARTPSPATANAAARRPRPRSRSSTRPSGATSSGCSTTRPRWPPSSRSWPGSAGRARAPAPPTDRSGRRQLRRLDREEQRLLDAYQAEAIDLAELKERRRTDPRPAAGPRRPA